MVSQYYCDTWDRPVKPKIGTCSFLRTVRGTAVCAENSACPYFSGVPGAGGGARERDATRVPGRRRAEPFQRVRRGRRLARLSHFRPGGRLAILEGEST